MIEHRSDFVNIGPILRTDVREHRSDRLSPYRGGQTGRMFRCSRTGRMFGGRMYLERQTYETDKEATEGIERAAAIVCGPSR